MGLSSRSRSPLYIITFWVVVALLSLFPVASLLRAAFPVFTILWIIIPLIGGWAAARTGSIWPSLLSATLCNLGLAAMVL
jgi:hypothetical protein